MRQKRVRTATDEHGEIVRDSHGHPVLIEEWVDKGPRITGTSTERRMLHTWARKRFYTSSPPADADVALRSSWPTPVPNRRRRKRDDIEHEPVAKIAA